MPTAKAKTKSAGVCSYEGCERPCGAGLQICAAHYAREHRKSKLVGTEIPIRDHRSDHPRVSGAVVTDELHKALTLAAAYEELSVYEFCRRLYIKWGEFAAKESDGPTLSLALVGRELPKGPLTARTPAVRIPPDLHKRLTTVAGKADISVPALLQRIVYQWYAYWYSVKK